MSSRTSSVQKVFSATRSKTSSILRSLKALDVQHDKPLRELENRDTILPITIASLLFCMWGLAYGLLDLMNFHIKVAMGIKREEAAVLAATYYAAYIPIPRFVAGPMIKRCGYRVTMVFGLMMLAIGDFLMSVGAQAYSLPGMALSHFVVGIGVSSLERAANPYAVNCGPRNRATLRILFAQAWAGIGTVIAPFLANAFVFNAHSSTLAPSRDPSNPAKCVMLDAVVLGNLNSVIQFYRGIGACIIGLAIALSLVFFRTNWMPEVPELTSPEVDCRWKLWKHPLCSVRYARLWWGVVANFVNLGCQVTFAQFFMEHMKVNACASDRWAAMYMSFAQIGFVAGRFTAAGLVMFPKIFKPRYVLAVFVTGAVVFTGVGTKVTSGAAIVCAIMVMFSEAPSFPMIFESATADFNEWTSSAETLMIMSISGGALQPVLMGKLVSHIGISNGWWLTTGAFAVVLSYTLANNIIPSFRNSLDAAQIDGRGSAEDDEDKTQSTVTVTEHVEVAPSFSTGNRKYFGGV